MEKQHDKEQSYIDTVEADEKDDVQILKCSPLHLTLYFLDSERICNNTLGYVASDEHRAYMAAANDANDEIIYSGEISHREPARTKRGNQKLKSRNWAGSMGCLSNLREIRISCKGIYQEVFDFQR